MDFTGRIALVTGAARGIGLASARLLAGNGANVVVVDELPEIDAVAEELSCLAIQADMADSQAIAELYQRVHSEFGRLDILVNNAGILGDSRLGMIGDHMLDRVMAVNLTGAIRNIQAASKLMRRSGGGAMVAVGSIIGQRGNAGQVVYAASKAGLAGAVLSAAKELGPDNIRVNAVAPGFIDTQMIRALSPEITAERVASIPLGRPGTPEEVAEVIVFLCSEQARYVTGQVVGVDGGMVV